MALKAVSRSFTYITLASYFTFVYFTVTYLISNALCGEDR